MLRGELHALQVVYKWGSTLSFNLIPAWPLLALPAGVFPKVGPGSHRTWWTSVIMHCH